MIPVTTMSRMEYIDSIPFAENTVQTLPTNGGLIPNDRFLHSLLLEFRGRLTMPASSGPTGVNADGHAAIIERVTVEGYHRIRRQQEKFVDLRGADLELLQRVYLPSPLPKTPTSISVTASATNDMIVQVLVPFVPLRANPVQQAGFLLDAPNYESLKLSIQWADYKNVVSGGTAAATWSAYGSTTGDPALRVYGLFSMNQARFAGFVPGRIFRYGQLISGSPATTTASGVRLWDIPRGFDIRALALKTGVLATTTSGNTAFSSHTEFLTDLRINLGLGKYIRRYLDYGAVYADLACNYNLQSKIDGFAVIDFAPHGDLRESLNTRSLIGGPTGNVDLYLSADVTGAADQAIQTMIEEVRYRPITAGGR